MQEMRCRICRKLLARVSGATVEVKCPRCGQMNLKATEPQTRAPRAPSSGGPDGHNEEAGAGRQSSGP